MFLSCSLRTDDVAWVNEYFDCIAGRDQIQRQNRLVPNVFGLSERNVQVAGAVNARMDASAQERPKIWHRADPDHGLLSTAISFRQDGIFGAKNAIDRSSKKESRRKSQVNAHV
jgi:hypothetical protein